MGRGPVERFASSRLLLLVCYQPSISPIDLVEELSVLRRDDAGGLALLVGVHVHLERVLLVETGVEVAGPVLGNEIVRAVLLLLVLFLVMSKTQERVFLVLQGVVQGKNHLETETETSL